MQTHQLKRNNPNMKRMIVARGGKRGKTAGRGGKGQSARAGNKRRPEWRDIIKKIPKLRGRGVNQFKSIETKPVAINLGQIESAFNANDSVTPTTLVEKGVLSTLSGRIPTVKILGDGELSKALKVSGCTISESAKAAIEKAGGSVTLRPSVIAAQEKAAKEAAKPAPAPVSSAKATEAKKEKPAKAEKKAAAPKKEKK